MVQSMADTCFSPIFFLFYVMNFEVDSGYDSVENCKIVISIQKDII
jgi:hypothetical protein